MTRDKAEVGKKVSRILSLNRGAGEHKEVFPN